MVIDINDINTALENEQALLHDGDEMLYETFQYFQSLKKKERDLLFSQFVSQDKTAPKFSVCCTCPRCGKVYKVPISRYKSNEIRNDGFSLGIYWRGISSHTPEWDEFKQYIEEKLHLAKPLLCVKCSEELYNEFSRIKDEFYQNPLLWVNTNDPEVGGWQWKECTKLIKYPSNFKNIPDGFNYCGVHYRDRYNNIIRSSFDANYILWKEIKEKTTIEKIPSSIKLFIEDILRTHPLIDDPYNSRKKSVEIAENFLDGLLSGTDLPVLLDYVGTEIGKIQKRISVPPVPTHIFKFGKYKGYDVHRIIEIDRDYITWALEKVEDFIMSEDEWKHYRGEDWKEKETSVEEVENIEDSTDPGAGLPDVSDSSKAEMEKTEYPWDLVSGKFLSDRSDKLINS